jgi:hypothetical protein
MDETRVYPVYEDDDDWTIPDDDREYEAASRDEVPFHIPRD